jgi:hypothetical protein
MLSNMGDDRQQTGANNASKGVESMIEDPKEIECPWCHGAGGRWQIINDIGYFEECPACRGSQKVLPTYRIVIRNC